MMPIPVIVGSGECDERRFDVSVTVCQCGMFEQEELV